ncbi:MAG: hypothetical protein JW882_17290 [Deltaproteobacteria bacterium]|nr:hypothetical protein [Deltaproteobacteria bacterium]
MAIKPRRELKTIGLSENIIAYFQTGEKCFENWACSEEKLKERWQYYEENLLPGWIKQRPCTRPYYWWEYAAPRWDDPLEGWAIHGTLPEPRRRLGGVGNPAYEHLAYLPNFEYGLPTTWVTESEVQYYNGRAKDIHGNIIPTPYKEGNFKGKAIDPDDPPVYESEAAYLQRHGLLTATEKKWLAGYPEALEAVKIES